MTENTNIQFLTNDQAREVKYHIRNIYDEDRKAKVKEFKKTSEYKTLAKEINESNYAKELQEDRETLLKHYDELMVIVNAVSQNNNKEVALNVIREGFDRRTYFDRERSPQAFMLSYAECKHLYRDDAVDAILEGNSREEFDTKLGKRISMRLRSKIDGRINHKVTEYFLENEMDAIIVTLEAADLSVLKEKIFEKLPMDEVNAVYLEEEDNEDNDTPQSDMSK